MTIMIVLQHPSLLGLFKNQPLDGRNHGEFTEAENGLAKSSEEERGLGGPWAPERMPVLNSSAWHCLRGQRPKTMEKAKRIDVTSRYIFPFAFASFNVAYWSHYLTQAQQEYEDTVLSM